MKILVFNAGSSSLKFELFEARGSRLLSLQEGHFDNHGKPIKDFEGAVKKAIDSLGKFFNEGAPRALAIGHRVVHGGETYTKPTKITPAVIARIRALFSLAPLHNPPNLACILACRKIFGGDVPQVAVFDTAFHNTMPERAFLYGLPYSLAKKLGVRRYGFHGTSHQYVFEQAQKKLGRKKTRRTVTCHLGNGCSLAAILDGRVIDTSMGFTPMEGVPMGTRSGDIDAGIIFHLLKNGFSAHDAENLLNKHAGLLGVSEISGDMRDLHAAAQKGPAAKKIAAKRAIDWFCYRIAKYIGSYAVALGGLDCVVFTGGMGEKAAYLRARIMKYVHAVARPRVLVTPTDEEKKIAEETLSLLLS